MPIEFPPTYKYTPFTDNLVFSDRVPSFTDRILFRLITLNLAHVDMMITVTTDLQAHRADRRRPFGARSMIALLFVRAVTTSPLWRC